MKKFGFFSLGEIFIGNGMGKWGGEINLNTFGNMAHLSGAGTHWIINFWIVQFKTFKLVGFLSKKYRFHSHIPKETLASATQMSDPKWDRKTTQGKFRVYSKIQLLPNKHPKYALLKQQIVHFPKQHLVGNL